MKPKMPRPAKASLLKKAFCEAYITLADGRKFGLGVRLTGHPQTDAQLLRTLATTLQQGTLVEATQ